MSAIFLNNAIVHYEVLGRGKPVIFLHSWIGSWRYWIPSMQFTSTNFRAYAIDFWGFGATNKVPSRYSLEQQVILLNDFIEYMGVADFTLVGHGLGGIIGIYYASDHPESVERLMVISFPMGIQSANSRLSSMSPEQAADWLLGQNPPNAESREDARKADPQAKSTALKQYNQVNWRQLIHRVPVSSIWIHGQNDQAISNPTGEQLTHLPELSDHLTFSDSGHYPMLDEPSKFHRLLSKFLELSPGDDPRQLDIKPMWKRRVR
jgi:pimeloyl-ACP methyl ester carboxylesterase